MSRRDEGKADRRLRIVSAARAMIVEAGGDGFSMRALADRAGVSLVTPYSLFGSKAGVITALLDAEVKAMIAAVEPLPRFFATEMLFQLVEETERTHTDNEVYLRYLLRMSYDSPSTDKYIVMRDRHIGECVELAVRQGELSRRLPPQTITQALSAMYAGQLLAYSMGRSTLAKVTRDCIVGFALVLDAVASPPLRSHLHRKLNPHVSAGIELAGFVEM